MRQETLTVVVPTADPERAARAIEDVDPTRLFGDTALGVHFGRVVVVPGAGGAAHVALESNFDTDVDGEDASRAAHLAALAKSGGATDLRRALGDVDLFASALAPATVTYQGHPMRELARVRLEQRVREVVMTFCESADPVAPYELFARIRAHVRGRARVDPELRGLDVDAPPPPLPDPAVRLEKLRAGWQPWVENASPVLPALRYALDVVRWDKNDRFYDLRARQEALTPTDRARLEAIAATEDHGLHNALTHVVPLRGGGRGRLAVLRAVHAYIHAMAQRHFGYIGQLGGIPTIHFAKWLLLDEGQTLLFFSNYDGTWESYLGDFVDRAALGLNLAWSCTDEYPRTAWLYEDGAQDEEAFKAWGRIYQHPTPLFYSAYPDVSIAALDNNTWIRHALHLEAHQVDLERWFRRLT